MTNGETTEIQYLNELARRAYRNDQSLAIKVKLVKGSPSTVVKKLTSPHGDTSDYDEVWIVVDEDDFDVGPLMDACRRNSASKWVAVVSRPSFETWLVAHYEMVGKHMHQRDAKRQLAKITGRSEDEKELPAGFPVENWEDAARQCRLAGRQEEALNTLPAKPGSGMPHLLRRLGLID